MRRKEAFTLIELLVVMAITAVMMTLIVVPIFQSFNLTRNAQAFSDAQDKGRLLTERIAREVGNAISVRGGTGAGQTVINRGDITQPTGYGPISVAPMTIIVRVPGRNGTVVETQLPNVKLDLIPPAQGSPDPTLPAGVFRDPNTGKVDPTLRRPKGDVRLPVAPGATIVRWWVGPNDPMRPYNEPYTGLLQTRNGQRDNLFVLRRAEVQPFVYRINKNGAANSGAWRPNLTYFRSDDATDTEIIDLDDPRFFIPDEGQIQNVNDPTKNERVAAWAKGSVVQTEVSRYDMVRPVTTGPAAQPVMAYDPVNGNVPLLVPLVQFQATRVASAPATGSAAARPGESIDGFDRIGPDTYQTERALWTNAIVRYYPSGYVSGGRMQVASTDGAGEFVIWNGLSDGSGLDAIHPGPDNFKLFNHTVYEKGISQQTRYPFTAAVLSADGWDQSVPVPGRPWTPELSQREIFTPFRVITSTGKIVTSFPVEEVGFNNLPAGSGPNLPTLAVATEYSPTQATASDPTYVSAPLSPVGAGTGAYDPNRAFNRAWNAYPQHQGLLQRFIDLRFVANLDGTFSPLNPTAPDASIGKITGFSFNTANGGSLNRVRIVPGSDEVYGPDQTTTGAYSRIVRYTRVAGNPGPNQYRLVYADLPEPTDGGNQVDYGTLGFTTAELAGFAPQAYDPNNFVSAMIQPRYKAGYLQLCSDPNVPLPVGNLTIRYRFQLNGPGDTFAVDYDTREVMQILLTIKNYPQSSVPNAQTITLKSTATLRNALR